ncbi:unnamed protein product [Meloidogyne enterolobii]|uniref:Uncharacterized protein n=1 Tax=Meloidogyne enterolobii TaxID=390850 RepID=A0ACB0ZFX8_MELEN
MLLKLLGNLKAIKAKSDKNHELHVTNNNENLQNNVNNPRNVNDAKSYIANRPKINFTYKRRNKQLVPINSESEYEPGENSEQDANNFENHNEYENVNTEETLTENNDNYTDNERNFLQIVEYTNDLCEPVPLEIDYSGSIYKLEYGQSNDGQAPGTSYQENVNADQFPSTSYRANSAKGKHSKTELRL